MRFLMMAKGAEGQGMPPDALIEAIEKSADELSKNGKMVLRGGLFPAAQAARIRVEGGKVTVSDGPFAEAKEVVGGFAIFEFKSRAEAVQSAKEWAELHGRFWPAWVGETEVRQIFDGAPDFDMLQK